LRRRPARSAAERLTENDFEFFRILISRDSPSQQNARMNRMLKKLSIRSKRYALAFGRADVSVFNTLGTTEVVP
jgi:hypothetical protein